MHKKFSNIFLDIVIVILTVLLCVIFALKGSGMQLKAVLTGSMQPELPVGSLILIKPTSYENINIGDNITFVRDAALTVVTHKVVSKDDANMTLTTQGTANNTPDGPTSYSNVIGVVIWHIPAIGYIIIWESTLYGKTTTAVVILCLLGISIISGDDEKQKG